MKKSLLALAVAAAVSPAAFAQTNVTLYGIADVGVSADRTGVNGQDTAIRVNSGYMSTSRFGITGSEDLGAGLKGIFTLELGFGGDTGGFTQYRGNPGGPTASPQGAASQAGTTNQFGTTIAAGFNRRSFVGLQSGFGTIALGRDYTPFFWAQLATDNLGYGLYGNLLNSTALSGTGSELFSRASNAIFYTSPKFAGLTIRGMASAGSESFNGNIPGAVAPRLANQMFGLGAEYGAGPLTVAAAYQQVRLATVATIAGAPAFTGGTDIRRDWTVGAKYNFGLFSLGGGYAQIDPRDFALLNGATVGLGGIDDARQAWLGGTIGLGRGSLIVQYNHVQQRYINQGDGNARTWAVAYTYPFSRRTTAYATLGYVNNSANSALGLFASDNSVGGGAAAAARTGAAGADPRGFAIGVRHSF